MRKTTLYLSPELQSRLREAARREGRPQADLVREAVTDYLAKRPSPQPRSIGMVSVGPENGLDASTVKEWAREHRIEDLGRKAPQAKAARGRSKQPRRARRADA